MESVHIKKRNIPLELLQYFKLKKQNRWCLRNIVIWEKPNCMPSSVKDRFTVNYEPIFFWTHSGEKYWFEPQYEPHIWAEKDYRSKIHGGVKSGGKTATGAYATNKVAYGQFGRNKRCVWKIPTQPYPESHFAVFPEKLVEIPIKAGCPEMICKKCGVAREKIFKSNWRETKEDFMRETKHSENKESVERRRDTALYARMGDSQKEFINYTDCHCNAGWKNGTILDPFMGSGTTALVAQKLKRNWIGIELNPEYIKLAEKRIAQQVMI